tara:strand:- start:38342 stop:39715 length:1374 start_codon:yes stop_codon:yes gene_type:complete
MSAEQIEIVLDAYYGGTTWRTSGSMTAAQIETALDAYYGNTVWRTDANTQNSGATIESLLDTYYGNTDWRTGSSPTAVADKETAYALTGISAGALYETTDTGQILEKTSHVLAIAQSFNISDAGSPEAFGSLDCSGIWNRDATLVQYNAENSSAVMVHDGTSWVIKPSNKASFTAPASANTVHPADVAGAWTTDAFGTGTIGSGAVTVYEPRNWKHDGVLLVENNDEKLLLVNLPDTQQTKVVGEGGRVERFTGAATPDLYGSFFVSADGSPTDAVSGPLDEEYVWDGISGWFGGVSGNTACYHSGTRWELGWYAGDDHHSDPCSVDVHPSNATGWVSGSLGGLGQVNIYPESVETNWSDIIGTFELTVNVVNVGAGAQPIVDFVTYSDGATLFGWVEAKPLTFTRETGYQAVELITIDGGTIEVSSPFLFTNGDATGEVYLPTIPKARAITIEFNR